jgi:hypothetical protein
VRENDLYADVIGGLLREGCAVYKIADGSVGKKPFDIGGCSRDGHAIGLEIKAPNRAEANGLDWALFEPHQIRWLRAYASFDGVSLAAVYDKKSHVMLVWRLSCGDDSCKRPPDARLRSTDGFFSGWTALFAVGKDIVEEQQD